MRWPLRAGWQAVPGERGKPKIAPEFPLPARRMSGPLKSGLMATGARNGPIVYRGSGPLGQVQIRHA